MARTLKDTTRSPEKPSASILVSNRNTPQHLFDRHLVRLMYDLQADTLIWKAGALGHALLQRVGVDFGALNEWADESLARAPSRMVRIPVLRYIFTIENQRSPSELVEDASVQLMTTSDTQPSPMQLFLQNPQTEPAAA